MSVVYCGAGYMKSPTMKFCVSPDGNQLHKVGMVEPAEIFVLASAAFLVAGLVKGVVGIGLPTAALGIMTLAIEPRTAIALILFPMLTTNAWQVWQAGEMGRTASRYAPFACLLVVGVVITGLWTADWNDAFILGTLGVVLLIYVWVSWAGWIPGLPERWDRVSQIIFGTFAGGIGGLTGTWAVPIAIYLSAKRTEKDEFIRATGFLIFLGSLPLIATYQYLGYFTAPLAIMSAVLMLPAFVGLWVGTHIRSRLNADAFRTAIWVAFIALGLNMLRRAIWA